MAPCFPAGVSHHTGENLPECAHTPPGLNYSSLTLKLLKASRDAKSVMMYAEMRKAYRTWCGRRQQDCSSSQRRYFLPLLRVFCPSSPDYPSLL